MQEEGAATTTPERRTIQTRYLRDGDGVLYAELDAVIEFIRPHLVSERADAVELEMRCSADRAEKENARGRRWSLW